MNPYFLLLIGLMVLAYVAQAAVRKAMAAGHEMEAAGGMTGAQAAMAAVDGRVDRGAIAPPAASALRYEKAGFDHYDPAARAIRLSPENATGRSVTAVAVALHETGHALQHAERSALFGLRTAFFPAASIGSQWAFPLVLLGAFMGFTGLIWAGVVAFGLALAFHLVTLPLEFDASARAMRLADEVGVLQAPDERAMAKRVLTAAAMTYVVATLIALAQFLYYLSAARRR